MGEVQEGSGRGRGGKIRKDSDGVQVKERGVLVSILKLSREEGGRPQLQYDKEVRREEERRQERKTPYLLQQHSREP